MWLSYLYLIVEWHLKKNFKHDGYWYFSVTTLAIFARWKLRRNSKTASLNNTVNNLSDVWQSLWVLETSTSSFCFSCSVKLSSALMIGCPQITRNASFEFRDYLKACDRPLTSHPCRHGGPGPWGLGPANLEATDSFWRWPAAISLVRCVPYALVRHLRPTGRWIC